MAKKEKEKPQKLTLFDKEYLIDDLKDEQKGMINHISDLENKTNSMTFNLEQLKVGKESFINKLKDSLESKKVEEEK